MIGKADDLTVFGKNREEHDRNLHKLLKTAKRYDLVISPNAKCSSESGLFWSLVWS